MGMLDGKTSLVTGAGQGIGRAIAECLAREGAQVVAADFNEAMGAETAERIQAAGGEAVFVYGDVSEEASVQAMVEAAVQHFGKLDTACNSAAVSRGSGPIHEYTREIFD